MATATLSRAAARRASYPATPVPTRRQLHLMNRMGMGFSVGLFAQMRRAGGATAWFEQQLDHLTVPESPKANAVASWFPQLTTHSAARKKQSDENDSYTSYLYATDLANYSLQRRIYSNRTLHEVMVDFWSTHLHVNARHFPGFTQRYAYDEMIRARALGRFEDLLVEATLHPAMLMFLDNYKSTRGKPNENHGRELLELHTVGRGTGYTEAEVKAAATILSGWTVDDTTWERVYDSSRHTTGPVRVLGFTHANGSADGRAVTEAFLRYLARHEATARTVCRKMAVRFVADNPDPAYVERLVRVYLDSGTDTKAVLRAIVASDEFWASAGQKVRSPVDDVVATARALRVKAKAPTSKSSYVHELSGSIRSVRLFQWPRPDGPPDTADAWCSTSRMLNSWRSHWSLAGGFWPDGQVVYRKPVAYLPQKRIRFDQLVDHVSREVLGRPADERLLKAAVQGTEVPAGEIITRTHILMRYRFHRLLVALLDSPEHMTR